jgi:hypothetical protein
MNKGLGSSWLNYAKNTRPFTMVLDLDYGCCSASYAMLALLRRRSNRLQAVHHSAWWTDIGLF